MISDHSDFIEMEDIDEEDALNAFTPDERIFKQHFPFSYPLLANENDVDWVQAYNERCAIEYRNLSPLLVELFIRVKEDDYEGVRKIIDRMQNPAVWLVCDKLGYTLSYWVAVGQNQDLKNYYYQSMSEYFALEKSEIDNLDFTHLHHAVFANQPDNILMSHLTSGMNVDAIIKSRMTPLYLAAACNHYENAAFLIENGANVNAARKRDYHTPLNAAAEAGHLNMVKLLLEHGADPNSANIYDITPLFLAVRKRHIETARLLLSINRLDVNKKIHTGETPIWIAAEMGDLDMVDLLFSHGADADIHQHNKTNPLFVAADQKHYDVALYLLERGASFCCIENPKALKEGVADYIINMNNIQEKKRLIESALHDEGSPLYLFFFYTRWLFKPSIRNKRSSVYKLHTHSEELNALDPQDEEELSASFLSMNPSCLFPPPSYLHDQTLSDGMEMTRK